jgi:hypothetical protein
MFPVMVSAWLNGRQLIKAKALAPAVSNDFIAHLMGISVQLKAGDLQ